MTTITHKVVLSCWTKITFVLLLDLPYVAQLPWRTAAAHRKSTSPSPLDILNYRALRVFEIEVVFGSSSTSLPQPYITGIALYCGNLFLEMITSTKLVPCGLLQHDTLEICCWCHTLAIVLMSLQVFWRCDMPLAVGFLCLSFILLFVHLAGLQWGLCCPSPCQRISKRQQVC